MRFPGHNEHFGRGFDEEGFGPRGGARGRRGHGGHGGPGRHGGPGAMPGPGFGHGPDLDPREHFGRGRGKGRGGRAGRGDLRTAVLLLVAEEPMHGYQIMNTIAERTEGNWKPSPGAIYPTLSLLEDEGLITVEKEAGRKLATITEAGTQLVDKQKQEWANFFDAYREPEGRPPFGPRGRGFSPRDGRRWFGNPALMESLGGLRQVIMDAREEDQDKVLDILDESIARIRELGNEDDEPAKD